MAVARVPPQIAEPLDCLGEQKEFGPALFTKLVPYAVTVAISIYEERRDRLVNNAIIAELEALTNRMHEILSGLNLPGCLQALEKPLGLPGTLVQHAEEMRQADALARVAAGFADVDKLRSADRALFDEGRALLASEEEEDNRLRRKHGTRSWTRLASRADPTTPHGGARLWASAAEIEGYLASSTGSDAVVRDKWAAVRDTLAVLAGPDRALLDAIPHARRAAAVPESLRPALGRLRAAYNDAQRLESRRRKHMEGLRQRARPPADDVRVDILAEAARLERVFPDTPLAAAHFEDFFDRRLDALYERDVEDVSGREVQEQERVLAEVTRAHREFEAQKRSGGGEKGAAREREAALQKMDDAYFKYKEIVSNLEVGRKFYNDLGCIVTQFRDGCRAWVNERMKEARALEE